MKRKISAVIACYRDAEAIPHMATRLRNCFEKIGVDYEIIFVNDCSPDNAREVLEALSSTSPSIVVINHTRNFGSQSAFDSGMRVATGDAVVLLDGDLQDPPELIEAFYAKWSEGYDVVYGERVNREASWFMRIAYKAFYRVFRASAYVEMPLDAGDFSLMDRKVVNVLIQLPEKNRFIRGLRAWVGFKQIGVPYHRPERMYGHSTNNLFSNFAWARRAIVSFSFTPLDAITWLGIVVVLLSFLGIVIQIGLRLLRPDLAPPGFATVIILILFMGGVQLLSISVIGAYLSHVYEEVKRRPSYIVKDIFNDPRIEQPKKEEISQNDR